MDRARRALVRSRRSLAVRDRGARARARPLGIDRVRATGNGDRAARARDDSRDARHGRRAEPAGVLALGRGRAARALHRPGGLRQRARLRGARRAGHRRIRRECSGHRHPALARRGGRDRAARAARALQRAHRRGPPRRDPRRRACVPAQPAVGERLRRERALRLHEDGRRGRVRPRTARVHRHRGRLRVRLPPARCGCLQRRASRARPSK